MRIEVELIELSGAGYIPAKDNGWQRDLMRECVEPNPGPSALDVLELFAKKAGVPSSDPRIEGLLNYIKTKAEFPNSDDVDCVTPDVLKTCFPGASDKGLENLSLFLNEVRSHFKAMSIPPVSSGPSSAPDAAPTGGSSIALAPSLNLSHLAGRASFVFVEGSEDVSIQKAIDMVNTTWEWANKLYDKYGNILGERFPIETVYSNNPSLEKLEFGLFYLFPPLLDSVFQSFKKALAGASGAGNPGQDSKLLALYQVTRFGKTKLCYSLGFERFVIILRGPDLLTKLPFEGEITATINYIAQQTTEIPDKQSRFTNIGKRIYRNLQLVSLWVHCYVELLQLLFNNATFVGWDDRKKKEAFLRISSNGMGALLVREIYNHRVVLLDDVEAFKKHLETMRRWAKQNDIVVVFDDFLASQSHLRHMFPHRVDEKDFHATGKRQVDELQTPEVQLTSFTSLLYALNSVSEDFSRDGVPIVYNSTRFSALKLLIERKHHDTSREYLELLKFCAVNMQVPEMVSVNDIDDFLKKYLLAFRKSSIITQCNLLTAVYWYTGRPGFFFEFVWKKILGLIVGTTLEQDQLCELITKKLRGEWLQSLEETVLRYLTDFTNKAKATSGNTLHRLYYFFVMHNGCVTFLDSDSDDAVNSGFAYLRAINSGALLMHMFVEPIVKKIFLAYANRLCPELLPEVSLNMVPVNQDPVYAEIARYYRANIGLGAEEILMRLYMRLSACADNLYTTLQRSCVKSGVQRDSVMSFVRLAKICTCGTATELQVGSEADFLINPRSGMVLRSDLERVDIAAPLEWLPEVSQEFSGKFLPPAATQAKNLNTHLTPALFYKPSEPKSALASLDPRNFFPRDSAQRTTFFTAYSSMEMYAVYVRIIAATRGFNATVVKHVRKHNESRYGLFQPIILLDLDDYNDQIPRFIETMDTEGSYDTKPKWSDNSFAIPAQHIPIPQLTAIVEIAQPLPDESLQSDFAFTYSTPSKKARHTI